MHLLFFCTLKCSFTFGQRTCLQITIVFESFLLSGATRYSGRVLSISYRSPGINHLSVEPRSSWWEWYWDTTIQMDSPRCRDVLCFRPFILDRAKIYIILELKLNHNFTLVFPIRRYYNFYLISLVLFLYVYLLLLCWNSWFLHILTSLRIWLTL